MVKYLIKIYNNRLKISKHTVHHSKPVRVPKLTLVYYNTHTHTMDGFNFHLYPPPYLKKNRIQITCGFQLVNLSFRHITASVELSCTQQHNQLINTFSFFLSQWLTLKNINFQIITYEYKYKHTNIQCNRTWKDIRGHLN